MQRLPFSGTPLALFNTSGMMTVCHKANDGDNHSHYNILSAFLTFGLSLVSSKKGNNTGIISPYRYQVNLINCMVKDISEKNDTAGLPIKCSTVHQFQGSERDTIIFDAVDCYRLPYPGVLLTSQKRDIANRLFNVAMTRSKGKFVVVCNSDYMRAKNVKQPLLLGSYINGVGGQFGKNFADFKSELSKVDLQSLHFFSSPNDARKELMIDLAKAKKKIRLDIPYPINYYADNKMIVDQIVDMISKKISGGKKIQVRVENPDGIPKKLMDYAITDTKAIEPLLIIDDEIIWYGMPSSDAEFKLKDGKTIHVHDRPIFRFIGKKTAEKIVEYFDWEKTPIVNSTKIVRPDGTTFADFISKNKKCPVCGRSMVYKPGYFSMHCSQNALCKGKIIITEEIVDEFLYPSKNELGLCCPVDSLSLKAVRTDRGWELQCFSETHVHKYPLL